MMRIKKSKRILRRSRHDDQFNSIVRFIRKGGEVNMKMAKETFKNARSESGMKAHKSTLEKVYKKDYIREELKKINLQIGHAEVLKIVNQVFLEEPKMTTEYANSLMRLSDEIENRVKALENKK